MAIQVRKGGAWRAITGAQIFQGGAWRPLVAIKVRAGGAWRTVANFTAPPPAPPSPGPPPAGPPPGPPPAGGGGTIALTLFPNPFYTSQISLVVTDTVTATPSGGLAPYSYAWSIISSSGPATITLANSTTAAVTITGNFSDYGTANATLRCTATDSLGTTTHADVSGTLTSTDPVGGG